MSPLFKAQLQIHFCVLLWGFTAILGKLISLDAFALVWWRMLIVTALLLPLPRVWRGLRALPPKLIATYAGIGVLVSLHWLGFYGAIKLANASVAVTCIALAPVFLAVIEPYVMKRRADRREFLLGAAVVPGVALVVGGIPQAMQIGLVIGVFSALADACFGALNKRYVHEADPLLVTTIELGAGFLFLTLISPFWPGALSGMLHWPSAHDLGLLLLLAVGCTILPFTLSLVALRELSAFAAQLAVNLEPVYAIVLAVLLLGEQRDLSLAFYIGVAVILSAVFIHPLLRRGAPIHAETLAVSESRGAAD
ncbi:Threonine/homoserine efflux transporter RhtA [Solimonas aquatica]|uniref:Threonine/homoserine efflux transporter RhtA n=1 Tax=Solimonas aquatica TaxID=489703 RepID=A0A1H9KRE0_9GAMM|nr:DMT family transporter [Solimonas aquatica]SER01736.1 Threonine/homoserine efflux transporter RhtA [Solimonas aquatica]